MYTADKKSYEHHLKQLKQIGVNEATPERARRISNGIKYIRIDNTDRCIEFGDIIEAMVSSIVELRKTIEQQNETIAKQNEKIQLLESLRGWTASKELQQVLSAKVEQLEKQISPVKKSRKVA